jgi:hypothetical protein
MRSDTRSNHLSQSDRNGISQLPHRLRPTVRKKVFIWESLQPGSFPHREITHLPGVESQHIFPAGNTMHSRLQGFGGLI